MKIDVDRVTSWLAGLSTLEWVVLVVGVAALVALAVLGFSWWRRRGANPPPAAVAAPPAMRSARALGNQLVADVRRFRRELPASARRSLDAFHPIIVLGTESSGKAAIVERFAGVAQRRVELGPCAELAGGQLRCVLGAGVVVFEPSEEVVRAPRELVDAGLSRALGPALRRRAPVVVVCLSPEILDKQSEPQLAELGGALRAKLDVLAALRDEPCAVRVVLSDVPGFARFDALFRLLQLPGIPAVLSIATFDDAAVQGALLGYSDEICTALTQLTPRETLELVGFLEVLPQLAGALAVLLGELFAPAGELTPRPDGLYLVPVTGGPNPLVIPDALLRPGTSPLLKHRLIAFSLAIVAGTMVLASYRRDATAWDHASTLVDSYDVKDDHELDLRVAIRGYARGGPGGLTDRLRPGFFVEGPAVAACSFVEHVRDDAVLRTLTATLDLPAGKRRPERALYAAALLYASEGSELAELIDERTDEWAAALKLPRSLVTDYLRLALPYRDERWLDRMRDVAKATMVDGVADRLALFLSLLAPDHAWAEGELAGVVELEDELRPELEDLEQYGAVQRVLAMPPLDQVKQAYEEVHGPRFSLLAQLWEHRVALGHLMDIVGAGAVHKSVASSTAGGEPRTFAALTAVLTPLLTAPAAAQTSAFSIAGQEYKLDTGNFTRAVRGQALERLVAGFVDRTAGQGARTLLADPARTGDVSLGISWPPGIAGADSHARMYSREVFQTEVQPAATGLHQLLGKLDEYAQLRDQLAQQLGQALEAYAAGYEQELGRMIGSFRVELSSEVTAQRILRVLAGSGSPMRALIAAVGHDAALGLAGDKSGVFDAMAAVEDHYGALAQLFVAGKAGDPFAAYQDVLRALGTRLVATPAGKPGAAAAPSPSEAITAQLSPAGTLVFAALQGAPDAPATALDAWLADKPLTDELADVFRAPVRAAYALGARDLEAALGAWDREIEAAAGADLFGRFPFDRGSGDDLDPQTLTAWLVPKRGRFAAELLPAAAGLVVQTRGWDGRPHHGSARVCTGDELCVRVPGALLATFDRLAAASELFFDDTGKPRPLEAGVTPRPFTLAGGGPMPELIRLTVGETTAFYFNQRPKRGVVSLDWTHDQTASLSVQLKQDGSVVLTPPALVASPGTPWSFFHLLQQAERRGQTYTWRIHLGTQILAVSYDVVDPTAGILGAATPRPRAVASRGRR